MSFVSKIVAAAAVAVAAAGAAPHVASAATYTYVGNWNVYDPAAPFWADSSYAPTGPLAYTAQEAAALLFGGTATDYVVSTVGDLAADIDFMAWYDVIGFGKSLFAQDYDNKYLGLYYGPQSGFGSGTDNAASAFVRDNLAGNTDLNYAFRISAVPLPAGLPLLLGGLGGIAIVRRRKRKDA